MGAFPLTRSERRVLGFIESRYPIPASEGAGDEVLIVGERPLPTPADCHVGCRMATLDETEAVLCRLVSFQLVRKIYLHGPDSVAQVWISAGRMVRMAALVPDPGGFHAYQVTGYGMKEADKTLGRSLFRWIGTILGRLLDKLLPF